MARPCSLPQMRRADFRTLPSLISERRSGPGPRARNGRLSAGDFSPTGNSFTYTLNADGLVDAYVVDSATLQARKIPARSGVNGFPAYPSSYSPSGAELILSHESSVQT